MTIPSATEPARPATDAPNPGSGRLSMARSILSLRCPECRRGKVFANSFLKMHSTCPVCSLKFEREPGYFLGAMYFSYGMAIPPLTAMTLAQKWFAPERSMLSCILVATLVFLPMVVPIVRYSRVMWLHLDRFFDPQDQPVDSPPKP